MITRGQLTPKTKKPRQVPMTPELTQVFRDLYKVRYLGKEKAFLRDGQSIRSVRTANENARKRAGVKDFRFRDTRHCAAADLRRAACIL